MAKVTITNIKEELVTFLRNNDVLSISERGVTTVTDESFTAAGGIKTFTLANTTLKNVRTVKVDSVVQTFGTEYTTAYPTAIITIPGVSDGETVEITYDYGTTDRIFPDYPQPTLRLSSFPRLTVDIISGTTTEQSLGGLSNNTDYTMSVIAYHTSLDSVESLVDTIRQKFLDNKKTFFYSTFITPTSMGPRIPSPFGEVKVFQRNQDFNIRFIFET